MFKLRTEKVYLTSFDILKNIQTPGVIYNPRGNNDDYFKNKFLKTKEHRFKLRVSNDIGVVDFA